MKNLINKTYNEVIEFLHEKYGKVNGDYFLTDSYKSVNTKIKRGKEGLYIHHIDEDKAIMLSDKKSIEFFGYPFEFQKADRLVYCNLLEHLLLHIKIVEYPNGQKYENHDVGVGGIINFMVPELNDIYSGITYKQPWKQAVISQVINKKDDYMLLLKKCKELGFTDEMLLTSLPMNRLIWDSKKNNKLYKEIRRI